MSDYLAHHHATPRGSAWTVAPQGRPAQRAPGTLSPTATLLGCVTGSSVATGAVIAGAGWPAVLVAALVAGAVAGIVATLASALHRAEGVIGRDTVQPPRSYLRSPAAYGLAHGLSHGRLRHD